MAGTAASRPDRVAFARAALYRLLGEGLAYPTADGVDLLRGPYLTAAVRATGQVDAETAAAMRQLCSARDELDLERAEADHIALFGHARSSRVVPYEGPYLTTNLFQESDALADVAGFYRAFGVTPAARQAERQDHVAMQLEFLYLLAYKEGHALRHDGAERAELCRDAQRAFLRAHLGRWAEPFFGGMHAAASGKWHLALAGVGLAFMRLERTRFGVESVGEAPRVAMPDAEEFVCPIGAPA